MPSGVLYAVGYRQILGGKNYMSHTYEKISGNKAKLTFTVPAEQFDEAMQKAYLKPRIPQGQGSPQPD